ncbi:MAG: 3-deoxy-7-phosphoheptulonate synthase [Deltaproteobacteria bacterium]|nr:MAG: 3-deoxy-7-phosphoheptulonate synthase [Deltaproteobacteria bacterium]
MRQTSDINVTANRVLPRPIDLLEEIPRTDAQSDLVTRSRQEINRIVFGDDPRLLVVVGPCSIHDVTSGREYAKRLADLANRVSDRLYLVMRVYFEKPRTSIGWKGLIMDPHLDGSGDIQGGLRLARSFLRDTLDLGLPTATELLDPITPQYIADLICWSAVGARTTESQTHRQMASGLSMPLGFKNGTDGNLHTAINAIKAASHPQTFLGISREGQASAVTTRGNPDCHIVLRGGTGGPNFDPETIRATEEQLIQAGLTPAIMVDCSHENSGKQPEKQPEVMGAVIDQVTSGTDSLIGVMVESHLEAGSQPFPAPTEDLRPGVSITDGCIDWETTQRLLLRAHEALAARFT